MFTKPTYKAARNINTTTRKSQKKTEYITITHTKLNNSLNQDCMIKRYCC